MESRIRLIYFDLGNVLVNFDHGRASRQMAAVAGIRQEVVHEVVFGGDLELAYERGDITTRGFYEAFCQRTSTLPDYDSLLLAAADIFELNQAIVPLVKQLHSRGHRLGILSNTNEAHWNFVTERYADLCGMFELHALSFQMRALKPDPSAYERAARLAAVDPAEVFFTDDRWENVAAARSAGFDAGQFVGVNELARQLDDLGILRQQP